MDEAYEVESIKSSAKKNGKNSNNSLPNRNRRPKIFSRKRTENQVTSRMGDLLTQKLPVPKNVQQIVSHQKVDQVKSSSQDEKSGEVNPIGDKSPTEKSSAPKT